jgi:capsular exopolysaccharide synthesis family protein
VELHDYLRAIRRRWRLIVVTVIVVVALADLFTALVDAQYTSTARMFVSTSDRTADQALAGSSFAIQRVSSYADLVGGRKLASRVSDDLNHQFTPAQVSAKVSATVEPESVILQISATDSDRRTAQRLAQATAQELSAIVKELETQPGKSAAPIKANILDAANLPTTPVSPQPLRNIAVGLLLGLLLGVGLAVARELLDPRINSQDDIDRISDLPVLGRIFLDAPKADQPLVTAASPRSQQAEAFRILRTNLQFVDADQGVRAIAVTSPVPDDAKTSTASNLALAMQSGGQRTLLIDGDLRTPQLAGIFKLRNEGGLSAVLAGDVELVDAVQVHGPSGLSVLPSGVSALPNPGDLLQPLALAKVLEAARRQFEIVVIDSPPLLPYSDAALIAAEADGVVVVIRCGAITREQFKESLERLHTVGARAFGVSLTMGAGRGRRDRGLGHRQSKSNHVRSRSRSRR